MGESLETISLGIFSEVLKDLEKGIRKLHSVGIENFVLIADHGFLYTLFRSDSDKISLPKGELILSSSNVAIFTSASLFFSVECTGTILTFFIDFLHRLQPSFVLPMSFLFVSLELLI